MQSRSRRLNVGGFLHGVPTWGACDKCGASFSIGPELSATPELAREKLLADFDAHECKSGGSEPRRTGHADGRNTTTQEGEKS